MGRYEVQFVLSEVHSICNSVHPLEPATGAGVGMGWTGLGSYLTEVPCHGTKCEGYEIRQLFGDLISLPPRSAGLDWAGLA